MIVRQAPQALHFITQPDHASLSRQIMEHWEALLTADRRGSILLAIEQHDNGWQELDAAPSINPATGRAYDFMDAPVDVRQAVWPRGVSRLARLDAWAAALVAQHAVTVYDRHRGDTAWSHFFPEMEARRDELVRTSGLTVSELLDDYTYVRIGDLVSLIFCNAWREELTYAGWSFRLDGWHVIVQPEAFGGRRVPMEIEARVLAEGPLTSDSELQDAFAAAPRLTISGSCGGEVGRGQAPNTSPRSPFC